uniref:L-dopachrome isomerase n=1 Tax=Arion vulgaris TaxID=1028688 RepID=A0A0B6ZUF7_9EUPU
MSTINIAGFVTTNVDSKSITDCFLSALSEMLAKMLHTEIEFVTLELQCNVVMMKAGSSFPMLNLRLFHNSNKVDIDTKHEYAKQIAEWLAKQIGIPENRVLVLFLDTRYCNAA